MKVIQKSVGLVLVIGAAAVPSAATARVSHFRASGSAARVGHIERVGRLSHFRHFATMRPVRCGPGIVDARRMTSYNHPAVMCPMVVWPVHHPVLIPPTILPVQ